MSPEHATAITMTLQKAAERLLFNGSPTGGALASEIAGARQDILRGIRMLDIAMRPAQSVPPQGALDAALKRTLKQWDEAHAV